MTATPAAIGWEACPVAWWIEIADQLERTGAPWCESAAMMDLRFWDGQIRLGRVARIPSRRRLAARWSWTDHAVRTLLRGETWRIDALHVAQNPPNNRPTIAQKPPSFGAKTPGEPHTDAHFSPTFRPTIAQSPPHARLTETENRDTEQIQAGGLAGTDLDSVSGDGRDRLWPDLVRDLQRVGYTTLEQIAQTGRDGLAADLGRSASRPRLDKIWRVLEANGIQVDPGRPASPPATSSTPSLAPALTLAERYATPAPTHQPGQAPWDLTDYTGDTNHGQ